MFYLFKNLKNSSGKYSHLTNYVNTLQFITLPKHDIYPHYNNFLMKDVQTNIIVHSGKLLLNLNKFQKKNKENKALFCEPSILFKTEKEHDIILTNQKYILTIPPGILFSFYSYDTAIFQLMFKSNGESKNYIINKNYTYNLSFIEKLK